MKVLRKVDEIEQVTNPVITIGTFDGIHLGHQQLIKHLQEKKQRYQGHSYIITFEPHPQLVLQSKASPIQILSTLDEKISYISEFNIDYLLILEFTPELSRLSGEQFIEDILIKRIGMVDVVIGYDHSFGYKRSGNVDTLRRYGKSHHFNVNVVEPFLVQNTVIKSTAIRNALKSGNIKDANKYLGKNYQLSGTVVKGRGRGRELSFPTANLKLNNPNKLVPGNGIYAAKININGNLYDSAVSIGIRPTFNETDRTIEAYIFDFSENIYGEEITIYFIKKLRDEEKFSTTNALISQMQNDVEIVKKVLSEY